MTKEQALKLIGDLAQASSAHALMANGLRRDKNAPMRERKAALKLLGALSPGDCDPTPEEFGRAMGW